MKLDIRPAVLVIFGITGNLARNKLVPALYNLIAEDKLDEQIAIVGIDRGKTSVVQLLGDIENKMKQRGVKVKPAVIDKLRKLMTMVHLDISEPEAYHKLRLRLDELEEERGACMHRLFYLSIPPQLFGTVVHGLGSSGLHTGCQHNDSESRLLVEKPFGESSTSAAELIRRMHEYFEESQIYRIDHYLAKETVQNILTFRFNNPIFEAVWNAEHIERVIITAAESAGIEWRGGFYENTGALRDIIQSHLMQLLSLVAMEEPAVMEAASIHAKKQQLLDTIAPIAAADVDRLAVRGQYDGYREEVENSDSITETYAAIKLHIDNDRWRDVPFLLQTGKCLAEKTTEIRLIFKHSGDAVQNIFTIQIQPDEGICLTLTVKQPGFEQSTQMVNMDFRYDRSFDGVNRDAYERVLVDAIRGDKTLFATSESVMAAWYIIDEVISAWATNGDSLEHYAQGHSGPAAAQILLESN